MGVVLTKPRQRKNSGPAGSKRLGRVVTTRSMTVRTARLQILVIGRIRRAALLPSRDDRSERAKNDAAKDPENRCRTTVAEAGLGRASATALLPGIRSSV
jgi:hypothetical protein